jgi:hypothetical protein
MPRFLTLYFLSDSRQNQEIHKCENTRPIDFFTLFLNAIEKIFLRELMNSKTQKKEQKFKEEEILQALEQVAERLSVHIHFEEMKAFEFRIQDGFCTIKGESHIYIDRKRPLREKIHILAEELKKFNLEEIYIPPLLRERVFSQPPPEGTDGDLLHAPVPVLDRTLTVNRPTEKESKK